MLLNLLLLALGCGAPPYYPKLRFGDSGVHPHDDTADTHDTVDTGDSALAGWPRDASGALCSEDGSVAVTFGVQNHTSDTLELYWVDTACQSTLYQTIAPAGAVSQGSFINHGWALRTQGTGTLVHTFVVQHNSQLEVVK